MTVAKKFQTIVALLLTLTVTVTVTSATSHANPINTSSSTTINATTSDDDILRGLLYGRGSVAEELGLWATLPQGVSERVYTQIIDTMIREFKLRYPDEINESLRLVRSDDPLQVEKGLDLLSTTFNRFQESMFAVNTRPGLHKPASPCGFAVACWAYAALAVHNTVVITALGAVVIGGAVVAGGWLWVGKNSLTPSVAREELVADLIEVV